ncbi:hypothetical protein P3X46_015051 [Hevea brasiliensis]|uniref:Uncharacterized protein n=1 Tax=Hevea brasiliensis TaxID=3981 RepID=A0ABQ9LWW9_HEVBR|nr:hypothetical protein P3X46_015051 [Hevea brasiliensis]
MEVQAHDAITDGPGVKATLKLGSEIDSVDANKGSTISEELISMKEKSTSALKEFIPKHNVPNDVPDDIVESSSEDEEEIPEKSQLKSNKTKHT